MTRSASHKQATKIFLSCHGHAVTSDIPNRGVEFNLYILLCLRLSCEEIWSNRVFPQRIFLNLFLYTKLYQVPEDFKAIDWRIYTIDWIEIEFSIIKQKVYWRINSHLTSSPADSQIPVLWHWSAESDD